MIPKLVTSALIVKDGSVLLLKNGRGPYKDYWGFPGGVGGWQNTSDPLEAIIAEVQGDVGCQFSGDFFTANYTNTHEPTVTLFYVGSITGEPIPVCKMVLEARYFPIEEARNMNLAYDHNEVLERYVKINSK